MLIYLLIVIIIILSAALGTTLFFYFSIKKDLKNIERQSRYIRENDTNLLINSISIDKDVHEMINAINRNIGDIQRLKQHIIREETEIKNVITNLSHDLRTPITSMLGYTQLLQKEALPEKQREYLEIISSRAEMLKGLVEQLFSYSLLMEQEALELRKEDITSVLEESIVLYYDEFEEKKIHLDLMLEEKPVFCMVAKASLRRVFMNIISNALKYGEEEMMIEQRGSHICFKNKTSYIDTIDTQKIFDRFFTVAKNRVNGSMGLGLTITKELVEKMGGSISAFKQENYLVIAISFGD